MHLLSLHLSSCGYIPIFPFTCNTNNTEATPLCANAWAWLCVHMICYSGALGRDSEWLYVYVTGFFCLGDISELSIGDVRNTFLGSFELFKYPLCPPPPPSLNRFLAKSLCPRIYTHWYNSNWEVPLDDLIPHCALYCKSCVWWRVRACYLYSAPVHWVYYSLGRVCH